MTNNAKAVNVTEVLSGAEAQRKYPWKHCCGESGGISDFHWSLDGKQLALSYGRTDADVVLIRDSHQR